MNYNNPVLRMLETHLKKETDNKNTVKANAYKKAIELAKRKDPKLVIKLEESWANYLVENKETEMAINHYVEAGKF